jgi:hypothetical protein
MTIELSSKVGERTEGGMGRKFYIKDEETSREFFNRNYSLTPWPESARELYRPSDRRLSAKLVPTFAAIG